MNPPSSSRDSLSSSKVNIVVDRLIDRCPLRPTGLLASLGYSKLTYPKSWGEIGSAIQSLTPHEWIYDQDLKSIPEAGRRLGVITCSWIETKSQFSISPLINMFLERKSSASLVVVVDDDNFELRGELRPIIEEDWSSRLTYQELYNETKEWFSNHGLGFTIRDSNSVYFQLQAGFYQWMTGEKISTLASFFKLALESPFLPFWDDFGKVMGYGIKLPTANEQVVAAFLSRHVEMEQNSEVLLEFCRETLREKTYLLSPGSREQNIRGIHEKVEQETKRFLLLQQKRSKEGAIEHE